MKLHSRSAHIQDAKQRAPAAALTHTHQHSHSHILLLLWITVLMATFLTFCILMTTFCTTVIWVEADKGELRTLHRQKREWIVPPNKLYENVDYTRNEFIAKIRSDEETRTDIVYSLIGPAADEGLFSVGAKNGYVRIHGILDREKTASYDLKGRAMLRNGSLAEKDIELKIIVLDKNDWVPVFNVRVNGSVEELSDKDTHVIEIKAFDGDEQDTLYSKIAYRIIQQEPAGEMMFKIERSSGQIKVRMNTLDRESQETYKLIIMGTDMDGVNSDPQNKPLTGTGTVTINILDVNDNIPILEKDSYESSVEENIKNVEAVRLKVIDKDKPHTENWEAVFTIISGNEAGHFKITTDPKTNEGILIVTKELNYEGLNEVNLTVLVRNKATYHKSVVTDKPITYPINIKVVNVPEAPHFHPTVKVISISEDHKTIDLKKVITTYTATDSDTLLTASCRYVKGDDVDNWVSINEQTAEIRFNRYPDRESKFLINGTYYAKILCITSDFSPKTATGTLAIQVHDFNDHCPILTSSVQTLSYGDSVVYVTAKDEDKYPNADPFEFRMITKSTKENWRVERLNGTTIILRSQEILWPGHYTVGLEVQDQQGKSCEVQKLQVAVLTERQTSKGIGLGGGGVLALLLGILLLLLIPVLLLLCECGGAAALGSFQAFPFEQNQELISYHTEGQGEDKEPALLSQVPLNVNGGSSMKVGTGWRTHEGSRKYGWESQKEFINQWHVNQYEGDYADKKANVIGGNSEFFTMSTLDYMALPETYLGNYYTKKTLDMVKQEASTNQLMLSNYEVCNSVTGSLEDICSHLHEENNLDFLDDLGPQFKRLAEICCGSTIEFEVSSTPTPPKTVSSSSQVGIKVQGAVGGVHSEATSISASSSSSTTQITTANYGESIISGGATSAATVGQTLLVQQPSVYLSSTPMYVVEQQHHPTLLLASGPMLGVQKSNMVLVEKGGTNMAIAAQNTLPRLGLQQSNTRVLVDPGIGGTVVHGFPGQPETQGTISGTYRVVESRRVESTEPVGVMQSSSHSSTSKNQSMQAKEQSGGIMALGNASDIPSAISLLQQDMPQFDVPNGGTHKEVREERVSVVEKSFQSSSSS
ncbi:desmoglein-2-like protein [Pangasianodon hypophthalmus]|uniref:desmoglein-2-like protein n=1 Tax=Pangasianodon hypophthalmus TaxID=310915 RepID=UPI002307072A|nr:desmoglein-2-like protein [Pangasianodon hypophthalmus]